MQVDLNVPAALIGQLPNDVLGGVLLASLPHGSLPLGGARLGVAVSVDQNMVAMLLPLGFTVITYNQAEAPNNDGLPPPDTIYG